MLPAVCKRKPWVPDYTCGARVTIDASQIALVNGVNLLTDYVVALRENAALALEAKVSKHFPVITATRIINTSSIAYIIVYATHNHNHNHAHPIIQQSYSYHHVTTCIQ